MLEVGPGLGALTAVLAERAQRVVAVEVDRDLVPRCGSDSRAHRTSLIVERDVLDASPGELLEAGGGSAPYVVVANLPYNIAAPVLRHFLEGDVRAAAARRHGAAGGGRGDRGAAGRDEPA